MRAVIGLVVAFVPAHVEVALVEAIDHLEAEHVLAARLAELAAHLAHHVARDLGRRCVARRNDRRVRHEHEVVLGGSALGVLDERLDLLAAHVALRALFVPGVERVEQDHRLDALGDRLAEDLRGGAVARAPRREREVTHVRALLAALLFHALFDALEDPRKERRVGEPRLVRARAEPEIDPDQDGAVPRLDELFADGLVTVKMHDQIEPAVGANRALVRRDHLSERDVLPLVVDAEPGVGRHARVRAVAVLRRRLGRGVGRRRGVGLFQMVVVGRGVAFRGQRVSDRGQREQKRGGGDEHGRETRGEGQVRGQTSHACRETSSFLPWGA